MLKTLQAMNEHHDKIYSRAFDIVKRIRDGLGYPYSEVELIEVFDGHVSINYPYVDQDNYAYDVPITDFCNDWMQWADTYINDEVEQEKEIAEYNKRKEEEKEKQELRRLIGKYGVLNTSDTSVF